MTDPTPEPEITPPSEPIQQPEIDPGSTPYEVPQQPGDNDGEFQRPGAD